MPFLALWTSLCSLYLVVVPFVCHFLALSVSAFPFSPPLSPSLVVVAMSPSLHHFKGRASEAISYRKLPQSEQALLKELVPKPALHLLHTLSDEEKEILVILVLFGRNALLALKDSVPAGKYPWRPWKSSSPKAGTRQQVCSSCPFFDVLDASTPSAEEGSSQRSSLPHTKYKGGFSCYCFSCYSRVWCRWNACPNRDVINDVLDVVEGAPQSISQASKGKKKKKLDKKRGNWEKKGDVDESLHPQTALLSGALGLIGEGSHPLKTMDTSCAALADDAPHISIAMENGRSITDEKITEGCKKSFLRGLREREKPSDTFSNAAPTVGSAGNTISSIVSTSGGSESASGAVAIEIPENLTLGLSPIGALGSSSAVLQGKITAKLHHHRLGKRRSSQILPLDCEDVLVDETEQEADMVLENTEMSISPRAPDVGLGGRGFLSRVFPDALGRVASRLWDLVSVRLRSRTVEYH